MEEENQKERRGKGRGMDRRGSCIIMSHTQAHTHLLGLVVLPSTFFFVVFLLGVGKIERRG